MIKMLIENCIDRERMIVEVKRIRAEFYDKTHKFSHGLGALFQENFRAAVSVLYGNGDDLMRTGHLASEYASNFAEDMGMNSKEEWAGWIINQNKIYVQKVYEVERRYLRMTYRDKNVTAEQIEEFRTFCEAI